MLKTVKISVLMSVYNTDFSYTKRAIDSVLKQDFQDFELIIVDDGSSAENSMEILQYAENYEDKIVYIRHSNRGQSESINRGVLISRGKFVTIIDSDDEYKPQHLSVCYQEVKSIDLLCSSTETVVDSIADYYVPDKNDKTQLIHLDDSILFGTLFGRKEVFASINFENGFAADADFYERAEKQFRVKKLDLRTYIYYRNNPNSICANVKRQYAKNSN